MTNLRLLLTVLIIVMTTGCDFFQEQETEIEFAVDSQFEFGNEVKGYSPVTALWVSGDHNNWVLGGDDNKATLGPDLIFRYKLKVKKGETIKYKFQIGTVAVPNPTWWTFMNKAYESGLVLAPYEGVYFDPDGFEGMNAVYTVPK